MVLTRQPAHSPGSYGRSLMPLNLTPFSTISPPYASSLIFPRFLPGNGCLGSLTGYFVRRFSWRQKHPNLAKKNKGFQEN
jgi:hypothetical protein